MVATTAEQLSTQGVREAKEALLWYHAERLAEDLTRGYSARQLAVDNYLSASQVRQYAKTAQIFSSDQRTDLPFEVHVVCAQSTDPFYWLEWAVTHQASKREVQRAMRDTHAPQTMELWQRGAEAIEQHFRRWAESGAPVSLIHDVADRVERLASLYKMRGED